MPITEEVLKNTFTVNDLSPLNLSIDDVDYTIVGEYTTNIYATDSSGNIANKEIKVIVKEPTINIEQANISLTVGETITLNATVQGASQTITWTSSDESVVTVDANGVVTAVKEGTATITASANGIKDTTEIRIQSNQRSSNGKSNTSSSSSKSGSSSSSSSNGSSGSTSTGTHKHTMPVGNMGRWFSSRSELVSYYQSVVDKWNSKYENGEISYDELYANVPSGYEAYSCSTCGKWSGNFKYFN